MTDRFRSSSRTSNLSGGYGRPTHPPPSNSTFHVNNSFEPRYATIGLTAFMATCTIQEQEHSEGKTFKPDSLERRFAAGQHACLSSGDNELDIQPLSSQCLIKYRQTIHRLK
jgi:hypothetical protein